MIKANAKTIEIFLPDGDPKSIKVSSITSRNVEVTYIPRKKLDLAKQRENLSRAGVYILVGYSEDHDKAEVYIGEAENCIQRIFQHNSSKDFWQYVIVANSKINQFTKTHGKYLEWISCEKAKETNRCLLNNSISPSKPHVSEPMEADLQDSFETISVLISTLGLPIFQLAREKDHNTNDENLIFSIQRKGIIGHGQYTDEGFVVLKGSKCHKNTTPSLGAPIVKKRQTMINEKYLIDCGDYYELTEDYLFNSPSYAAATITGRSANGWTAWVLKNGKNLSDIYRVDKNIS